MICPRLRGVSAETDRFWSIEAKSDDRINLERSTCREIAGGEGGPGQENGHAEKDEGVARVYSVKQRAHQPCRAERRE